jgi:acyl-CoA thioesterase FadM
MAAPDEGHGGIHHVSNLGIAQVLFEARNRYFERLPVPGGIWNARVIPMIRELLIRYEGEVEVGTPLRCTVAVTGRSRRSLTMEERAEDISDPDRPRAVASARSVHVAVDTEAGGASEVPPALLALIEELQGAPVPGPD